MPNNVAIPRLVIAGTSSGVGKTTVTVGLVRALRSRGLKVAAFKCGPDYLDPTYHARAAGVPSHNLDGWMMGQKAVTATFARASRGADVAVIEGVMGLFDGASPIDEAGSTAEIAKWLVAPVFLVVDASGMARTIGAIARGFVEFDRGLRLSGLICNKVGSESHLNLLCEATDFPPVLGGLPKDQTPSFSSRHLGLRTADDRVLPDSIVAALGTTVDKWCDVDAILAFASDAPPISAFADVSSVETPECCRIGIAFDEAFHFYYEDNLAQLEAAGARLIRFSPIHDSKLPDVSGIYLGGGYPEEYAVELAANESMRREIAAFASSGGVVYGECGGLMYLSSALRTLKGTCYPMCGVFRATITMRDRIQALGYVEVETSCDSILGPAGVRFRGHQFRYSDIEVSDSLSRGFTMTRRRDGKSFQEGYQIGRALGSYVHAHWASNPDIPASIVKACSGK